MATTLDFELLDLSLNSDRECRNSARRAVDCAQERESAPGRVSEPSPGRVAWQRRAARRERVRAMPRSGMPSRLW